MRTESKLATGEEEQHAGKSNKAREYQKRALDVRIEIGDRGGEAEGSETWEHCSNRLVNMTRPEN